MANTGNNQLTKQRFVIHGECHPDFIPVSNELLKQLPKKSHGGASVCVYHKGHKVVDVWAGTRDDEGNPWEQDTVSLSFSTTKGIASTLLHILASQGKIDYDKPVAYYWPEFAKSGKQQVTVRQLLCHEAGLYDIHSMLEDAAHMTDWDTMTDILSSQTPKHMPGQANGYHALTYGWLVGEVMQRATGKSFQQLLQSELVDPLDLDGLYVGLPQQQLHRRAKLIRASKAPSSNTSSSTDRKKRKPLLKKVGRKTQKTLIESAIRFVGNDPEEFRNGLMPKGIRNFDFNDEQVVSACIPAANGMFTARSLARVYAMMANGGKWNHEALINPQIFRQLSTVHSRRRDRVIPLKMNWRLGYHRVFTTGPKTPHAFGHFGFGGSGAWCDPSRELSVALTLNSGVGTPMGDSRIARINSRAIRCAELNRG